MKTNLRLEYYKSEYLVDFLTQYPVDWCQRQKHLAERGGLADCEADGWTAVGKDPRYPSVLMRRDEVA